MSLQISKNYNEKPGYKKETTIEITIESTESISRQGNSIENDIDIDTKLSLLMKSLTIIQSKPT